MLVELYVTFKSFNSSKLSSNKLYFWDLLIKVIVVLSCHTSKELDLFLNKELEHNKIIIKSSLIKSYSLIPTYTTWLVLCAPKYFSLIQMPVC